MLLNYLFQFMEATNKDTACIIKQNLAGWVWEPARFNLGTPIANWAFLAFLLSCSSLLNAAWKQNMSLALHTSYCPVSGDAPLQRAPVWSWNIIKKEEKRIRKAVLVLKVGSLQKIWIIMLTKTSSLASVATVEKESFCCPIILQEGPVIKQRIRISK